MEFNHKIPDWQNEGAEPSNELKASGFSGGWKVPATILNWLFSKVAKSVTELQSNLSSHVEDKNNPHGVTTQQLGLDKVNNTADSEKSVKFASEAGVGRKVQYPIEIHLDGGRTEGTDQFTYDGSTSRSVNITPEKIGGAEKDLSNVDESVFKSKAIKSGMVVPATSTDGAVYTATVDGLTELYDGMELTIIPNAKSTQTLITLNVNGLGAKPIRQPLSFSTYVATSAEAGFLYNDTPCRLMYHANYPNLVNGVSGKGIWLMADKQKTSAQDLYGNVPIESGGTGADTAEQARANLGLSDAAHIKLGSYTGTGSEAVTLAFDFEPKCLIFLIGTGVPKMAILIKGHANGLYNNPNQSVEEQIAGITWDGNTVTITDSEMNFGNAPYTYIALG